MKITERPAAQTGLSTGEEPRKCGHESLSGRETEAGRGICGLFQPPASPLAQLLACGLEGASISCSQSSLERVLSCDAQLGVCRRVSGQELSLIQKKKGSHGKACQPGLPCFLPLNTCEADGWSAGSRTVTKRQQIYTRR